MNVAMHASASTACKSSNWKEIVSVLAILGGVGVLALMVIEWPRIQGMKRFKVIPQGMTLNEVVSTLGPPRSTVIGTNAKRDSIPSSYGSRTVFSPAVGCKGLVYDRPWAMSLVVMHFDADDRFTHLEENGT